MSTQNVDEPKNAPELLIGRFVKSKSPVGKRVILVDLQANTLTS